MELYPHNQKAYENALAIFREHNRTCIIHPTGTGKAVIIGKFIAEHPISRHLLLGPGKHIATEVKKHAYGVQFSFSTYHGMLSNASFQTLTEFDFIYLDEFHRIGAELWGPAVVSLVRNNPNAKILGTTATHIRFLDDERDMAFELFKNNVASHITLNRAFVEGILLPPKYVTAMYSVKDEYAQLEEKILTSIDKNKSTTLAELKAKMIDWEKSSGIDSIIEKHLSPDTKRIIVFCNNVQSMRDAEKVLLPILGNLFDDVTPLHVHSYYSEKHNNGQLALFNTQSEEVRILFTVDMLNEGLHGKDISTVILLRNTSSPNIFYQQIGRCFSIGQRQRPTIIDLVNNFKHLQLSTFRDDFMAERGRLGDSSAENRARSDLGVKDGLGIEFYDETQELQQLFRTFSSWVEQWEIFFREAETFFKNHGHLYVTAADVELRNWLLSQRNQYRRKTLNDEKIARLSKIGMDWEIGEDAKWTSKFEKLKKLVEERGGEPEIMGDKDLRTWLWRQRKKAGRGALKPVQRQLLEGVVSMTDGVFRQKWAKKVAVLREFRQKHGDFVFRRDHALYGTIASVRTAYKYGSLPKDIVDELNELGLIARFSVNELWATSYERVKDYLRTCSELPKYATDRKLYAWVSRQQLLYKRGELSDVYVTLLREIGLIEKV